MPQAVGYAFVYAITVLGSTGVAAAAAAYYAGVTLAYAAGAYLMNEASKALTPKAPKQKGNGWSANYAGTSQPRQLIYGEVVVGGMEVIPPIATGPDGKLLNRVIALAGHECYQITDCYFDDATIGSGNIGAISGTVNDGLVNAGTYANHAWIRRYTGTSTQTRDYVLNQADPTAFGTQFRGRGIAYAAIQYKFNDKVYEAGVPNFRAKVNGKMCYDPRTGVVGPGATTNPAIAARDFLLNEVGFPASEIDDDLIETAADVCDVSVTTPGGMQPRYTCNLLLDSGDDWLENLQSIVDCMRGRFVYRDGKWRIYAGGWESPQATIDTKDWAGPTTVKASAPLEERWNAVRVWYVDASRNYQRMECYQRRNTTYEADDGERLWLELEIPGVNNDYEAQRHGEFALRASRNQLRISGRLLPGFHVLATWDTVTVTDSDYGWSAKTFRVVSMEMLPTGECDVVLVEEGSSTWANLVNGDYNTITAWATIDPGASLPAERTGFVVTPQPAAIEFAWNVTSDKMPGELTRIIEYASSGYAHLGTELWRGDATRVNIQKTDVVTRYYWIQGVVGSYTGEYTPNTFGYPMAANSAAAGAAGTDGVMVALTLPAVTLGANVAGTIADYGPANGTLQVLKGGVDVTSYAATRASSQAGVTGTVNSGHGVPWASQSKGAYRVTAVTSDQGVLWTEAIYSGTAYVRPFVVSKAKTGSAGLDSISGFLSNENVTLPASLNGYVPSWTNAEGLFRVYDGVSSVSGSATFSVESQAGCTAQINTADDSPVAGKVRGYYRVTAVTSNIGVAHYRAVYGGVALDKQFTVSKALGGQPGTSGGNALVGYLTNEYVALPSSSNGYVPSYAGADGTMVMMLGVTSIDVSSITFAVGSNPQALTQVFSVNGTYRVTAGFDTGENLAALWLRGTYDGTAVDKSFTLGKAKSGVTGAPGDSGTLLYIYPHSGSVLYNGVGVVKLEAYSLTSSGSFPITTGSAALYIGSTLVSSANGFDASSGANGYIGVLDATDIGSSKVVTLKVAGTASVDSQSQVQVQYAFTGGDFGNTGGQINSAYGYPNVLDTLLLVNLSAEATVIDESFTVYYGGVLGTQIGPYAVSSGPSETALRTFGWNDSDLSGLTKGNTYSLTTSNLGNNDNGNQAQLYWLRNANQNLSSVALFDTVVQSGALDVSSVRVTIPTSGMLLLHTQLWGDAITQASVAMSGTNLLTNTLVFDWATAQVDGRVEIHATSAYTGFWTRTSSSQGTDRHVARTIVIGPQQYSVGGGGDVVYDTLTVLNVEGGAASMLRLLATGQQFRYSGSGTNIGVSTLGFDAILENLSGTAAFRVNNFRQDGTQINSYTLAGAGNTGRILHVNSFTSAGSTAYATVIASLTGGYFDQITVVRVAEGAGGGDALVGYLTNENHTLPSSNNGFVPAYTGADGRMVLMLGINSVNVNSITFSVNSNPQSITNVMSTNGHYRATAGFDIGEDTAVIWYRAVFSGTAVDRGFTLSKAIAGNQGNVGSQGPLGGFGGTVINPDISQLDANGRAIGWRYETWMTGSLADVRSGGGFNGTNAIILGSGNPSWSSVWNDGLIAIDPYRQELYLAAQIRSSTSSRQVYLTVVPVDAFGQYISPARGLSADHNEPFFTTTSYAAGATRISLIRSTAEFHRSAPPFNNAARLWFRPGSFATWGQHWGFTGYDLQVHEVVVTSRFSVASGDPNTTWVVDVSALPTSLYNGQGLWYGDDGGTFQYINQEFIPSSRYHKVEGSMIGVHAPFKRLVTDLAVQDTDSLRWGTRYVRVGLYAVPGTGDLLLSDMALIVRDREATHRFAIDPYCQFSGAWRPDYNFNASSQYVTFTPRSGPTRGCVTFHQASHGAWYRGIVADGWGVSSA